MNLNLNFWYFFFIGKERMKDSAQHILGYIASKACSIRTLAKLRFYSTQSSFGIHLTFRGQESELNRDMMRSIIVELCGSLKVSTHKTIFPECDIVFLSILGK
jgi:hypothetical protein